MNRRAFVNGAVLAGASLALASRVSRAGQAGRGRIIDAHCHAGRGLNYGKDNPPSDPWTTYNDPQWTLRRMEEAGIDQTILFPINNTTYREANEEIAGYVKKWPTKFIGFAKHDAKTEAGQIRDLLRHEVRALGLKGLKLHGVPSPEMVEAAAELGIPILYHPPTVEASLDVVRAHPKVSFILAHLGCLPHRIGGNMCARSRRPGRFPTCTWIHRPSSSWTTWSRRPATCRPRS